LAPFAQLAAQLGAMATDLGTGRVDLGGGFAGSPERYAAAVLPHLPDGLGLTVEPGRGIVSEAGWLVTRVVRVQPRGHVIADAGMTELIRPMLYGARHPVTLLTPGRELPPAPRWALDGPICEAGDLLASDLDLGPASGEGALLAIGEVGAYGLAMASNYNGRLRPAQAVIERGAVRLSRRRETLEDVVVRDA
jgi:diaminopimelate decarboxylase